MPKTLIAGYCTLLYGRYGTFEDVARRINLDRRTVKKYIGEWRKEIIFAAIALAQNSQVMRFFSPHIKSL